MMTDNQLNVEIGNRIYDRRKQIGMTQEKLAELTEITPQAISNYERGERELKAGTIINISRALNVSIDFLLTGKQENISFNEHYLNISQNKKIIIQDIIDKCTELVIADNE